MVIGSHPDEGQTNSPGGWIERVRVARLEAVFAQMPIALLVTLLNCGLASAVLAEVVPLAEVLAWFLVTALVTAIRLVLWSSYRKAPSSPPRIGHRTAIAVGGSLVSGLLWGVGVAAMFPTQVSYQFFLALLIGGMCAGTITVYSSHASTVLAFIVPSTLPLAWRFFQAGGRLQIAAGALTLIFAAALSVASRRFQGWFSETMSTRFSLEERTRELDQSNARLRQEITDHRATQDLLLQSQKIEAVSRLTAGVAHDFNNLLMVISGTADLIKLRLGPERSASLEVDAIHQATERGAVLADQLLAFGRKQALQPRLVDLNAVIRNMRPLLESTVGGGREIAVTLCAGPVAASVDPAQIENAVLNLVMNARDATAAGGRITITTGLVGLPAPPLHVDLPAGAYVVVTVADTGHGMSDEVRTRAFEPFFTTKGAGHGSGLGLSQVYGTVRQSGGATEITSAVGSGTTVRMYLPRSVESVPVLSRPADPAVAKATVRSGDAHILLVDDDPGVRATTASLLIEAGYSVDTAGSGEAALREIERGGMFDLIVVDLAMPDMGGDQLAAMARRRLPGVPVMFVTGYIDDTLLLRERWVLKKPFRGGVLIEMAGAAIDAGRSVVARR